MKTDLIINSKAGNKAVAKTITNVNPEVTNDKLETFAGMVNALSTNTYDSASRVDKKDVTEADSSSTKPFPTIVQTQNFNGNPDGDTGTYILTAKFTCNSSGSLAANTDKPAQLFCSVGRDGDNVTVRVKNWSQDVGSFVIALLVHDSDDFAAFQYVVNVNT